MIMRILLENGKKFSLVIIMFISLGAIASLTVFMRNPQNFPSDVFRAILVCWPILLFLAISGIFIIRNLFTETFVDIDEKGVSYSSVSTNGNLGKNEKHFFAWDSIEKVKFQLSDEARDSLGKIINSVDSWMEMAPLSDGAIKQILEDSGKEVQIAGALQNGGIPLPCVMVVYPRNPSKDMEKVYNFHIPKDGLVDVMRLVMPRVSAQVQTNYANAIRIFGRPYKIKKMGGPAQ